MDKCTCAQAQVEEDNKPFPYRWNFRCPHHGVESEWYVAEGQIRLTTEVMDDIRRKARP